jgi:4-hydroxy-tetrahydrodipicolinate reductase
MDTIILGDGPMGRAIASAWDARGEPGRILGRPAGRRHTANSIARPRLAFEASRGDAVGSNVAALASAGCRHVVIATTGWERDRSRVESILREHRAAAVWAPNFSIGVVVFGRLVEAAATLFGSLSDFEPYLVEWHRRSKRDRPSGTARDLAERLLAAHPAKTRLARHRDGSPEPDELEVVTVRAGASPGMHLVGFDAPGETVELRLTARDRSAYAAGALAAADWLTARPRPSGLHPFATVVDDLLVGRGAIHPAA